MTQADRSAGEPPARRAVLTLEESRRRRELIDVTGYDVEVDLTGAATATSFSSTSTIRFACSRPGAETFVDVVASELTLARLNGEPLDVRLAERGRLRLTGLAATNELVVHGRFDYSTSGEGLHRFVDPQDGLTYLYSQMFLDQAARVYACFDQPDLKAPFTVSVTGPPDWVVLANTAGIQTRPGHWRFATTAPLPTYLTALVAGPYEGARSTHDGIDLGVWCRRSLWASLPVEQMFETTARGFDHYHRLLDIRYPFGKYDQVMVPEFNAGAMENPGLVTFRDERFVRTGTTTATDRFDLARVQLHELAHMWFGDLVTMRWWDDLWLNESFADLMSYQALAEATPHTDAWSVFAARRKSWGYRADGRTTTHPVASDATDTDQALVNFDGISYAKGAAALRQLQHWVGPVPFRDGLRRYLSAHRFGNARLADLVHALTETSGQDVQTWARRWLRTSGTSTVALTAEVDEHGRYAGARIHQEAPAIDPTLRPHRMALGLYDVVDGAGLEAGSPADTTTRPRGSRLSHRRTLPLDLPAAAVHDLPDLVGEARADLVLPNDGDLTFALVRLDPHSLDTVLRHLGTIEEPLTRTLLWTTLWQMVGSGHLAPSTYAELAGRALPPDERPWVLTMVLDNAVHATRLWVRPDGRAAVAATLGAYLLQACHAGPGTDSQLDHARAWIRLTDDTGLLDAWSRGEDLPDGLRLDADLRWRLLLALARHGALDEARLDDELDRERTSEATLHHLSALAALPDPAAKARAWQSVLHGGLSNHRLSAVGTGFWQPGQDDILRPYAAEFVSGLPVVLAGGSSGLVEKYVLTCAPRTAIDQATVDLLSQVVRDEQLPASVRRLVADERDDLEQGLRARAADLAKP